MRGDDNQQEGIFSYISPEKRVPADHPLRPIRKMVDEILKEMSPQFQKLYSDVGRPSIAPERLLRSLLLQIFYSVRSERMLIEQLQYNLLFRWFVGMEMDEAVWNHAVFSKNRERLLNEEIAEGFFQRVLERAKPHMSDEHFTVDGTLIEAWAIVRTFVGVKGATVAVPEGYRHTGPTLIPSRLSLPRLRTFSDAYMLGPGNDTRTCCDVCPGSNVDPISVQNESIPLHLAKQPALNH